MLLLAKFPLLFDLFIGEIWSVEGIERTAVIRFGISLREQEGLCCRTILHGREEDLGIKSVLPATGEQEPVTVC
jgi:hypothetical protein